ncbi:phage holin family protein [Sphingomonas swuensis]
MLKRTETTTGEAEGIGDLVQRLVEDGKAYARAEVAYYKTLGTEKASAIKTPLLLGLGALLFAHAAFLVLIATIFVGLASLMSDTLAGVVTLVICLAVSGLLGSLAYSKAKSGMEDAQ